MIFSLASLVAWALAAACAAVSYQEMMQQHDEDHQRLSTVLARQLDERLAPLSLALLSAESQMHSAQAETPASKARVLAQVQSQLPFPATLLWLDAQGRPQTGALAGEPLISPPHGTEDAARAMLSLAILEKNTGPSLLAWRAEENGFIAVDVPPSYFSPLLASLSQLAADEKTEGHHHTGISLRLTSAPERVLSLGATDGPALHQTLPLYGLDLTTILDPHFAFARWQAQIKIGAWAGLGIFTLSIVLAALLRRRMRHDAQNAQKLAEQEVRFRTFFNAAFEGIVISERGIIIDANSALEILTGHSVADLCGTPMLNYIHEDDRPLVLQAIRHPTSAPYTVRIRQKSGIWFEAEVRGRVQPDNPDIRLTAIRDVSHRRAHEEQMQALVAELERSNHELEQFAYVASHDLQEPLRTVASYVGLLQRRYGKVLGDDGREFISFAVAGAHRMQALVQGLLEFSRVKTQSQAPVPCDLNALLQDVLDGLSAAIRDTEASITCPTPLPTVMGDPQQLSRLLQNLLSNAIKYRHMQIAPQISISCTTESSNGQDLWQISVQDNGIGISPEHADKVFIIFQRLHGRDHYEGTGIGLAISKRIVECHGGNIWLDTSYAGPGSRFALTLPVVNTSEVASVAA